MARSLLILFAVSSLLLTACGGADEPTTSQTDAAEADTVLQLVGQDDLRWDVEELSAPAGTIAFELTCEDAVNHNVVIDELDVEVAACGPGETGTGAIDLEPGTYTYVCTIPGHEATMRGTLEVS